MKSVCEKHQQAYEAGAGCPYCEPDEARADGGMPGYDLLPVSWMGASSVGSNAGGYILESRRMANSAPADTDHLTEHIASAEEATPKHDPSRDVWWNAYGDSIPKGFELAPDANKNIDADVWRLMCPNCKIGAHIAISGLEQLQNSGGRLVDLVFSRRDSALGVIRNKGCSHAVMPKAKP